MPRGARDVDDAGLERLAKHFQHAPVPFRQLVEKQDSVVRERYFARPRIAAAADERHGACGVMRRPERSIAPALRGEASGERGDRGGLERLVLGERRQERRQALSEHRLARSRRPDEKHAMAPRRRDLQRGIGLTSLLTYYWITRATNRAILEHLDGRHVFDLNVEYFIGMPSWVAARYCKAGRRPPLITLQQA